MIKAAVLGVWITVTLTTDWRKVTGRTACSIGTAVTGDTGGVNVYEAIATSLSLLA